uniref:PH domain-containing protein n=1 Tax=Percolomonas cosmopolitus TaxID=63605 RepID=A0A7S1KRK0_9EUKA
MTNISSVASGTATSSRNSLSDSMASTPVAASQSNVGPAHERSFSHTFGASQAETATSDHSRSHSSTETIDFSKKLRTPRFSGRSEVEESLELDVFTKIGRGQVHVLAAVRVNQFTFNNMRSVKKERTIAVARDFVGSYGLFIVEGGSTAKLTIRKKYSSAVESYSLMQPFEVRELESLKNTVKFEMQLGEDVLTLATSTQLKDKLQDAMIYAVQANLNLPKVERATMRLATWDFLRSYHATTVDRSRLMGFIVEELITDSRKLHPYNGSNAKEELLRQYKLRLRFMDDRDVALEKISRVAKDKKLRSHFQNALVLLRIAVELPSHTKRVDLEKDLQTLLQWASKQKVNQKLINIPELSEELKALFQAQRAWKGRGYMTEKDFKNFALENSHSSAKYQKIRKRMRDSFAHKNIDPGVYVGVVLICDEEILQDNKENLPIRRLDRVYVNNLQNITPSHPHFEWMLNLGMHPCATAKALMASYYNHPSIPLIRKSFLEVLYSVRQEFNCDVGILHDKAIQLQGTNSVLFLMTRTLEDKNMVTIPQGCSWTNLHEFEHKQYQKYDNIDLIMRMEKLDESYHGIRWLRNAIQHEYNMHHPILDGFYVAYLKIFVAEDGNYVLVCNSQRNMIPHELVSRSQPSTQEWASIRSFFTDREQFIPSKYAVSAESPEHICKIFAQKFTRAFLRLKQSVNAEMDESSWYHIDPISIDEREQRKLCIFVDFATTMDLSEEDRGKFLWRKESVFENLNNLTYNTNAHKMWRDAMLSLESRDIAYNMTLESTDEIAKRLDSPYSVDVAELEKQWMCMQWIVQLEDWKTNHKENPEFATQIAEHMKSMRRFIISEAQKGQDGNWKNVATKMRAIDKHEIRTKDKANPVQPIKNPLFDEDFQREEDERWANIVPEHFTTSIDNLEDVRNSATLMREPTGEEVCSTLVEQLVETSLVECIDRSDFTQVKDVLMEMVDMIEMTETLVDTVNLTTTKEQVSEILFDNRQKYKEHLHNKFRNMVAGMEGEPEEITDGDKLELSYDPIIRSMVRCFKTTISQSTKLLQVINSAQESVELLEEVKSFEKSLQTEDKFLSSIPPAPRTVPVMSSNLDDITEDILEEFADFRPRPTQDARELHQNMQEFEVRLKNAQTPGSRRKRKQLLSTNKVVLGKNLQRKLANVHEDVSNYIIYKKVRTPKKARVSLLEQSEQNPNMRDFIEYRKVSNGPKRDVSLDFRASLDAASALQAANANFSLAAAAERLARSRQHQNEPRPRPSVSLKSSYVPEPQHSFVQNLHLQGELNSFAPEVLGDDYERARIEALVREKLRQQRFGLDRSLAQ